MLFNALTKSPHHGVHPITSLPAWCTLPTALMLVEQGKAGNSLDSSETNQSSVHNFFKFKLNKWLQPNLIFYKYLNKKMGCTDNSVKGTVVSGTVPLTYLDNISLFVHDNNSCSPQTSLCSN